MEEAGLISRKFLNLVSLNLYTKKHARDTRYKTHVQEIFDEWISILHVFAMLSSIFVYWVSKQSLLK